MELVVTFTPLPFSHPSSRYCLERRWGWPPTQSADGGEDKNSCPFTELKIVKIKFSEIFDLPVLYGRTEEHKLWGFENRMILT